VISILGKIWQKRGTDHEALQNIMSGYGVSEIVGAILSNRALPEGVGNFLLPKISKQMPDPFSLLDMKKAVDRFIKAIENKEKICLFADYDVDGATSAALLVRFLLHLKVEHFVYIPDRIKEGYGLSVAALEAISFKASCIVTLDCGSGAYAEVAFAASKGLDLIVIDHHIADKMLTDAVAVVNPNRIDETSDLQYLAAVGVTYLFLVGVVSHLRLKAKYAALLESFDLLLMLDLVALGTVCDVVPIVGLNRAFVSQGLKVIRMRTNLGIRTLIDCVNLQEYIRAYHLGFVLGPRINAGGRVGNSDLGVKLLTTNCKVQAEQIAQMLDEYNTQRKTIESQMLKQAQRIVESQELKSMIIVESDEWHVGVMGIVASRLVDLYRLPVAVIAWQGNIGKGSCRSVTGFDFGAAILSAKSLGLVVNGGGHKMAAGFTVDKSCFDELKAFLYKNALRNIDQQKLPYYFDATLTLESLQLCLLDQMDILEPFGSGNPIPCFNIQNVTVVYSKIVGENHVYCILGTSENHRHRVTATAFGAMHNKLGMMLLSKTKAPISVIATLQRHSWAGDEKVRCIIKDVIES
jgi:single-stranded-DNA-specific exonuclease